MGRVPPQDRRAAPAGDDGRASPSSSTSSGPGPAPAPWPTRPAGPASGPSSPPGSPSGTRNGRWWRWRCCGGRSRRWPPSTGRRPPPLPSAASGARSTAPPGAACCSAGSTPSTRPARFHEPRFGQVATIVVEPSTDRAENRFVAGVVRRLVALCRRGGDSPRSSARRRPGAGAERGHPGPGRPGRRAALVPTFRTAAMPRVSFLLRDHPHYRVMRTVADAIDDSLRWSPLPGDPAALGLRTQTLNALFEVWVSQAVRAAVRRRLGLAGAARGAAAPRRGRGGRHAPGPGAGLLRPGLPQARSPGRRRTASWPSPASAAPTPPSSGGRPAGSRWSWRSTPPGAATPTTTTTSSATPAPWPPAGPTRCWAGPGSCTRRSLVVYPRPPARGPRARLRPVAGHRVGAAVGGGLGASRRLPRPGPRRGRPAGSDSGRIHRELRRPSPVRDTGSVVAPGPVPARGTVDKKNRRSSGPLRT